ncbi:MAG: DUF3883 domain-containing protein [Candidatus Caldarchaeum sp.]
MRSTLPNQAEFYEQIRARNAERWGTDRLRIVQAFGRDLRATVRDMILELVQNAEDAGAQGLFFRLYENGLLVWNDGACFSDKDVASISGLLISTKDARSIGHFGIGFKSVLLVTRTPYILSGSHAFRLDWALDPYPVDSESLLPSEAWDLFQTGKTVFWLPFRDSPSHYASQVSRIFALDLAELLLFMHSLREIRWESPTAQAICTSTSEVISQEERATSQEIHIRFQESQEGKKAQESHWLRLDWQVEIPEPVIRDIVARLEDEGDMEGVSRWKNLSPDARWQAFSVAVSLDKKGRPHSVEGKAFARLPTGYRTDLKFHVSGRFATTVDRDRLQEDDPMTRWAVAETEQLLAQMPERLKRLGRFTPPMWAIFPERKGAQSLFASGADALRKALSEGEYFHGDDGNFHPPTDVYLAHSRELYDLLSDADLREVTGNPKARWVHPELREGEPRDVVRSLGVLSAEPSHVLRWLQSKDAAWFEARPDRWLGRLYRYLAGHEELRTASKELPVVRLHTRRCVRPGEALLPPEQFPEALKPYAHYLPLVDSSICQDKEAAEALRRLGVREFDLGRALDCFLQALYGGEDRPPAEENREHIRMLFALWNQGELPPRALHNWSSLPILRTRTGVYIPPNQAYLPPRLGGLKEVEAYFRLAGAESFVTEDYTQKEDKREQWSKFLEILGTARLPRTKTSVVNLRGWEQRALKEWLADRNTVNSRREREIYPSHAKRFRAIQMEIDSFEQVFKKVQEVNDLDAVQAFYLTIEALVEERHNLDLDILEYHYYYEDSRGYWYSLYVSPATWLYNLQTAPWLPDDKGTPSIPNRLFHPDLKPILGPGFPYVHERVGIRKGSKLAQLLGIHQEANVEDVLKYLEELPDGKADKAEIVQPIYEWLSRRPSQEAPMIRQRFRERALILIPGEGWFRSSEVCWRDRTGTVPEISEHWPDLKPFFLNTLQIRETPCPDQLAYVLLGWAEREPKPDLPRIRNLASALYERWDELSADLQRRLKTEPCWPARFGDEVKWERASHIYLRDREYIARLFGDTLPWWALDGMDDLAEKLGVSGVSTAQQNVHYVGSPKPDHALTHCLERIWPFVMRFAQPNDLPDTAPEIHRVAQIEVRYQIGYRFSDPDTAKSHLCREEWRLYLSEEIGRHPNRYIGDALERELGVQNLREFVRDMLDHLESSADLKETLRFWERERDVRLTDLLPVAPPATPERIVGSEIQPAKPPDVEAGFPLQAESHVALASPGWAEPSEEVRARDTRRRAEEGYPQYQRASDAAEQVPQEGESVRKDRIAEEAMKRAVKWWEERGFEVKDVSNATRLGYDLEVKKGDIVYYVEVKGTEQGERISITENEWEVAREKDKQYCLQVVTVPEGDVYLIWSPATVLAGEANQRERTVVQVHYEIPFPAIVRLAERG